MDHMKKKQKKHVIGKLWLHSETMVEYQNFSSVTVGDVTSIYLSLY